MTWIRSALEQVQENRLAFILLNLAYYGIVLVGMGLSAVNPQIQQTLMESVGQALTEGPLSAVAGAYTGGQVISAILLTFLINLILGSFIYITLPSLFIPFSGILLGFVRAILWGLLFAPITPELAMTMIPHSITLILEGQGYVLAMLAAYVHGRAFVWPESVDAENRLEGYLSGLVRAGWVYALVTLTLLVSAIYEALEVIYLVPALLNL